jgi:hypothetical protein
MKIEKYIYISSFVSYETKTSVTTSPVFFTAIEALLHLKKAKADASPHSSEKSYQFYEICNWVNIDSTQLFTKSEFDMEMMARKEAEELFPASLVPPVEVPPIV